MKIESWGAARIAVRTDKVVNKVVTGEIIGIALIWQFLCQLLPR